MRRRRILLFRASRALLLLLFNTLLLLLLVVSLDRVVGRVVGEAPRPLFDDPEFFVRNRPFVGPHPRRGFALRPGSESGRYRVNAAGFRGPERAGAPHSGPVILAVGDSTAFGWGVAEQETWPRQLESYLRDASGGQLRVINAGVPSYTSSQTLLYLQELLPRLEPAVVLVSVLWNDIWYSSLDPWFPEALTLGRPSPWIRWLYEHSALFRWRVLRPRSDETVDVFNERALAHYAANLDAMARDCAASAAAVAFLAPPLAPDRIASTRRPLRSPIGQGFFTPSFVVELGRRYRAAMEEVAARHGARVIDHRVSIANPHQPELYMDFVHPTPRGNRMIAEDVGHVLIAEGWLEARSG
jgi:lysophospholipase L1-like esterase